MNPPSDILITVKNNNQSLHWVLQAFTF